MTRNDFIYDVETYPNLFTLAVKTVATGDEWVFEISDRANEIGPILNLLYFIRSVPGARMVGFNNEGFDYPVIHELIQNGGAVTAGMLYQKAQAIIDGDRFVHVVWERDRFIEQVDLYKIHHFDNKAKSTGLKMLEFNMRSENIEDLPFPPGSFIPPHGIDTVRAYNLHDVRETAKFYDHSLPSIEFREELTRRYGRNFINFNDTKIGKEHFIGELEKAGIPCYDRSSGRREPRQTIRHSIHLGSLIFPYVAFDHPALQRFHQWIAQQTITETKGVFKDLGVTVNGFRFDFGLGGIHGSIDSAIVQANDEYEIIDLDVTSYYPSLSIVNRIYPEHLGPEFCDIYGGLKVERVKHPKGTAPNGMLKLGLNGTYGDSNNVFSPFYDPQFTMTITINGQLLLCMLSEMLMQIPGLRMVQANTDGVTVYCPRNRVDELRSVAAVWEAVTGLELEEARYSRMFIRDVNSYIAEYEETGKLKRKGAYEYELEWHQNQSALVVQKAAEAALVDGEDIRHFITGHSDPLDFMLRTKVPRNSRLEWELGSFGAHRLQNITRYYISNQGGTLTKVMPPPAGKEHQVIYVYRQPDGTEIEARTKTEIKQAEKKGTYARVFTRPTPERRIGINTGWLVTPCNDLRGVTEFDFNYEWYIAEAEKLVAPLKPFV